MIKKYRKKPVVIKALMYNGHNLNEVREFMITSPKYPKKVDRRIRIQTLAGAIYVDEGDYIIKGIHGEFYPCKPNIFQKTYEIVE